MEQVEVEITGQAITAQYGTLSTGTILRTTAEFAKHLVEDCNAAKYTGKKSAEAVKPAEAPAEVAPAASEQKPAPKLKKK